MLYKYVIFFYRKIYNHVYTEIFLQTHFFKKYFEKYQINFILAYFSKLLNSVCKHTSKLFEIFLNKIQDIFSTCIYTRHGIFVSGDIYINEQLEMLILNFSVVFIMY